MPAYREDRRIDAIPRVGGVTKNEAAAGTDVRREREYERLREGLADERRAASTGGARRPFAERLKAKP
jgi:hypothetical protein